MEYDHNVCIKKRKEYDHNIGTNFMLQLIGSFDLFLCMQFPTLRGIITKLYTFLSH